MNRCAGTSTPQAQHSCSKRLPPFPPYFHPRCRAVLQIRTSLRPYNNIPNRYGDTCPPLHRINSATCYAPILPALSSRSSSTCEILTRALSGTVDWLSACLIFALVSTAPYLRACTTNRYPQLSTFARGGNGQLSLCLASHSLWHGRRLLYIT